MELHDCGKCLKRAQSHYNVGTEALAADLNVSRHQIYRWRNMENWKVHTMQKICNSIGITYEQFINCK